MHIPNFVYTFIHMDGPLSFFHLLAIMNNVAMSMDIQISVGVPAFNYFEYILKMFLSSEMELLNQTLIYV